MPHHNEHKEPKEAKEPKEVHHKETTSPSASPSSFKKIKVEQDRRLLPSIIQEILVFIAVHYMAWLLVPILFLYLLSHFASIPMSYSAPIAILLYLPSFLDNSQVNLGRPWKSFRMHPIWSQMHKHCGIEVVRTTELPPGHSYIFGCHPHNILILSRVLVYGGIWEKLFPGIEFVVGGATPLFYIPCCREMCLWMGGVDASRHSLEKAIQKGKSIHLYPGGSKEIFETRPGSDETTLILKERKGFIRMAMKFGCPLVPVVVYGEKEVYHKMEISQGVRKWFLKNLKMALLIFWGKYRTWIPYRHPMVMVFGAPIHVPVNLNPTDEEIHQLQHVYIEALQKLFDEHKQNYPFAANQKLIIK